MTGRGDGIPPTPGPAMPGPAMPRQAVVERPRLMDRLQTRFDKRVVVIRAGAGFGKTTLLGQALAANVLEPRGEDVWIDLTVQRLATIGLAGLILQGLGDEQNQPTVDGVVNAVLQRAPRHVAIIIDNVHRTEPDRSRDVFEQLLTQMPSNGHLVIATRTDPPFKFRRLLASGEADLLTEDDLTFDETDMERFAEAREIGVDRLGPSGWPALVELRALDQQHAERHYIAEEVLANIEPERVAALRRLAMLGSFDDAEVEFVGGYRGSADRLIDGLPLTSRTPTGEVVLHDLWPTWLPPLTAAEHRDVCGRIAEIRARSGDLVQAFEMYCEAHEIEEATGILRRFACDYNTELSIRQRHELLALIPTELVDHPTVRLIEADLCFVVNPQSADLPLTRALVAAEQIGDDELVAQVMLRQGEILYRSHEAARLQQKLAAIVAMESTHVAMRAAQQLMEIWVAMSSGRMSDVLDRIAQSDVLAYPPTSLQAMSFRGLALGQSGYARKCLTALDELPPLHGRHAANVAGFRTVMQFFAGEMDQDGLANVLAILSTIEASQSTHTFVGGSAATAMYHFSAGDTDKARSLLAASADAVESLAPGAWARISYQVAQAVSEVVDGNEQAAAELLERALPVGDAFERLAPHIVYFAVVPSYLLLPRVRAFFDADECGPEFALGRRVAHALCALREDEDATLAAKLPWDDLDRIRPWVTETHLLELAVGAVTQNSRAAASALYMIRHDPHAALNLVRNRYGGAMTTAAETLLRETPERPTSVVRLEVLGDTRLVVDGSVFSDRALRTRVVELLHLLVDERRVARDHVMHKLWPGLATEKARNNLRVTLSLLVRLFEPNRDPGAVPWHIRSTGEYLELVSSPLLQLDVDEFADAMTAARRFERQGLPLDARAEYLRAVELYRGDYFQRTAASDVGFETRIRLRLDFVEAAARSAALLTASDMADKAVTIARRAIEVEPLDETGHIALLDALGAAKRHDEHHEAARICGALFAAEGLSPTASLDRLLADFGIG